MGKFYDSVPVSAIVRIRDMMYTVKDPFRLDQGDVSFDAPDTFKAGRRQGDGRQPHALPAHRRHSAAAQGRSPRRCARRTASRSDRTTRCSITNGGTHGLYAVMHALLEPGDEMIVPGSGMAADDGDLPGGRRRAGAGAAARRARLALEHRRGREGHHAEDPRALPQLAEQPDRRHPDARRHRTARRDRQEARPVGRSRTRPTRTCCSRASTSASRRCRACTTGPSRSTP